MWGYPAIWDRWSHSYLLSFFVFDVAITFWSWFCSLGFFAGLLYVMGNITDGRDNFFLFLRICGQSVTRFRLCFFSQNVGERGTQFLSFRFFGYEEYLFFGKHDWSLEKILNNWKYKIFVFEILFFVSITFGYTVFQGRLDSNRRQQVLLFIFIFAQNECESGKRLSCFDI